KWLKNEGDEVVKDEPLFTVEMDKGVVEVPAPAAGVLRGIRVSVGETVSVKTVLAEIEAAGTEGPGTPSAAPRAAGARLFATPRARLRARERNIELGAIRGSGPNGRIVEADVLAIAPRSQAAAVAAPAPLQGEQLSRLRRITAERMAASHRDVARVTLFLEADMDEAARFRGQLAPEFASAGVPKLPWDAIIAKAGALALLEHPAMIAQWVEGRGLAQPKGLHVGVAVALDPEGLVVPVLRDAATRSLRELAADLVSLSEKARAGRLSPNEIGGAAFTITNLGAQGIDGFTPLVNQPETAILGVGRIAEKPAVVDHQLAVRRQCTLSLSFDHRVIDGAPAGAFLARMAQILERPYMLLGI
ncbi:MAG: 2-oxo acid dehydrogenase subunit E2, partial [Chloroflexi bacterium]|nr:2-oxo acid dehydrogenase subunit E2 [Chloroflexota bacterium]